MQKTSDDLCFFGTYVGQNVAIFFVEASNTGEQIATTETAELIEAGLKPGPAKVVRKIMAGEDNSQETSNQDDEETVSASMSQASGFSMKAEKALVHLARGKIKYNF